LSVNNAKKEEHNTIMIDWWAGTVVFSFLPIVFAMLISAFNPSGFNLQRFVGDGELIFSAFIITSTTLIKIYNTGQKTNKVYSYLNLFLLFAQIVCYATVKSGSENFFIVLFASVVLVCSSIFVSRQCERLLKGGDKQ